MALGHGGAGLAALFDLALHGAGVDGIKADHGLVDDKDLRIMKQGGHDGGALARAAAAAHELAEKIVEDVGHRGGEVGKGRLPDVPEADRQR